MALERPKWAENYIKELQTGKTPDQITIVPGVMGGVRRPVYTGAGADGRVQADMPVSQDLTQFHEGELVIPAKDVKGLGGPEEAQAKIREMMKGGKVPTVTGYSKGGEVGEESKSHEKGEEKPNRAMMRIQQMQMRKMAAPSISGYKCGGRVKGYAGGGYVDPVKGWQPGTEPVVQGQAERTGTGDFQEPIVQGGNSGQTGNEVADASTQAIVDQRMAPAVTGGNSGQAEDPTQQFATQETAALANTNRQAGQNAAALRAAPTEGQTKLAPDGVNKLTYKNGQWLSDRQIALQTAGSFAPTVTAGGKTQAVEGPAVQANLVNGQTVKPVAPAVTPTTTAQPTAGYDRTANQMLQQLKSIATGDSDMLRRQAAAAFGNLDARLQTNMLSTAMRIANNPNLSEGAKRTMMAEEIRNTGIAQSQLAGSLADTAMNLAMQATGQALNAATGLSNTVYQRNIDKLNEYKSSGDIEGYAKLAKEVYGIDLNVDTLKSADALGKISDAQGFIADAFAQNPNTNLDSPGVRTAIKAVWDAEHPGVPMDENWARSQLATMGQTMSPSWQFMNGIDADAAIPFFANKPGGLEAFTFGKNADGSPKYTGLEAFRKAMYAFNTGGAFTIGEDGQIDFNEKSPIYQEFLNTLGGGVADGTVIADTTGKRVGDAFKAADGKSYTVASVDSSGNVVSVKDSTGTVKTLQEIRSTAAIPTTGIYANAQQGNKVYFNGSALTVEPSGASVIAKDESPTGYVDSRGIPVTVSKDGFAEYQPVAFVNGKTYVDGEEQTGWTKTSGTTASGNTLMSDKAGRIFTIDEATGETAGYTLADYDADYNTLQPAERVSRLQAMMKAPDADLVQISDKLLTQMNLIATVPDINGAQTDPDTLLTTLAGWNTPEGGTMAGYPPKSRQHNMALASAKAMGAIEDEIRRIMASPEVAGLPQYQKTAIQTQLKARLGYNSFKTYYDEYKDK